MKNKDLSNAIGNINLKYVEEAENFTAKRMSLTKIISLAACIAILVTAIPAALILNREDGKTDAPVVTTPFVIETTEPDKGNDNINIDNDNKTNDNTNTDALKVIYCSAESDAMKKEALQKALMSKNIEVREFVKYNESFLYKNEMLEYSEDIPKKLTFTLAGKEYSCTFDYVYNTNAVLSTNKTLRSYAKIACYKMDEPGYRGYEGHVLYRVATKEIVRIVHSIKEDEKGELKAEDIKPIAEKDFKYLYGEDRLNKYVLTEVYNSSLGKIIVYERFFGEYKTTERIRMCYNSHGELMSVMTESLGVFDLIENTVNDKILLASEAESLKLLDGQLVSQKLLMMGNDGVPYLSANITFEKDGRPASDYVYYKITR